MFLKLNPKQLGTAVRDCSGLDYLRWETHTQSGPCDVRTLFWFTQGRGKKSFTSYPA